MPSILAASTPSLSNTHPYFQSRHKVADAHTEPMQNILPHLHWNFSVMHGLLMAGGSLWDARACQHAERRWAPGGMPAHAPCTPTPMHSCTSAPMQPHTPAPTYPRTHASAHPGSHSSSCQRCGSSVCSLPFSGHGNCRCVMKCCQELGQEQSFVKEIKKNQTPKQNPNPTNQGKA